MGEGGRGECLLCAVLDGPTASRCTSASGSFGLEGCMPLLCSADPSGFRPRGMEHLPPSACRDWYSEPWKNAGSFEMGFEECIGALCQFVWEPSLLDGGRNMNGEEGGREGSGLPAACWWTRPPARALAVGEGGRVRGVSQPPPGRPPPGRPFLSWKGGGVSQPPPGRLPAGSELEEGSRLLPWDGWSEGPRWWWGPVSRVSPSRGLR